MIHTPDDSSAWEAFDYVMNCRAAYTKLGEAVRLFINRANRYKCTVVEELRAHFGVRKKYWSVVNAAIKLAVADWNHNFGDVEEKPGWVRLYDDWVRLGSPKCHQMFEDILLIGVKYRDSWNDTSELKIRRE